MSSPVGIKSIGKSPQILRFSREKCLPSLCKLVAVSGLILYALSIFFSHTRNCQPSWFISSLEPQKPSSPTNINHLVFGIAGSVQAWPSRKSYLEAWWKPNVTRGYIFLNKAPTVEMVPWPTSTPPFRVSEDTSKFEIYFKHVAPHVIRMVRVILESFREENEGVRWYIIGDDDTIFFTENLVKVLEKYDHTKYYYIGSISESTDANLDFSFDMAFGGAGFALSYPLAAELVRTLDDCIKRYPDYGVSDQILMSCIADLGVSLTPVVGFHQIDLFGDISGFLSSHPQSPLLSLHHLDIVNPIFPSMTSHKSIKHLMEAVNTDPSRVLQQTICYDKRTNWSLSVAWGYSTHIYEQIIPRSILKKPLETFQPWSSRTRPPFYMFNSRGIQTDDTSCDIPHFFYFESVAFDAAAPNLTVTSYLRSKQQNFRPCLSSGNHSAAHISRVLVFSPATSELRKVDGSKCECCDVFHVHGDAGVVEIKFRECMKNEIVA